MLSSCHLVLLHRQSVSASVYVLPDLIHLHKSQRLATVASLLQLNCPVLSPIVFTRPTRTRQDKTVLSRPCRRCEQAITVGYHRQRVSTVLKHLSSVICGSTAWKQAENEQNKYT